MRVASPLAWIAVGLLFGACSDEKPGAIVNEDISWLLGCEQGQCGSGLTTHSQSNDLETPFTVVCGNNGAYFDISVRDPGRTTEFVTVDGDTISPRNPSVLKITNVTEGGSCDVEVLERDVNASDPIPYRGKCGKGCELNVLGAQENWDFVGELTCDGLTSFGNDAEDSARYNLKQPGGGPVLIKVGNCNSRRVR